MATTVTPEQPGFIFRCWSALRKRPARRVASAIGGDSFGSTYGGYTAKTDILDKESVIYSFGIGEDLSFDQGLIARLGVTVHAFDPTPRALEFARRLGAPNIVLHDFGLLDRDGSITFNAPKNPAHVSQSVLDPSVSDRVTAIGAASFEVKRLHTIMRQLGHTRIDVLKMDVEGAEYAVFDDLTREPLPIGQILVEFHHMLPGIAVARTERAIDQLASLGFQPFAVSKTGREWSFVHCSQL